MDREAGTQVTDPKVVDRSAEAGFVYRGVPIRLEGYAADDHIFSSISGAATFYEIDLLEYMRAVLGTSAGCVIDVGANIGNHSVYFGKFIADYVVAVEANPAVADILERNLSRNQIAHAVFRVGLGAAPGFAAIELASEHRHNVGAARLTPAEHGPATIPMATLDSLQGEIDKLSCGRPIAAIKMDVEGMEPQVLRGGMRFLARHHPELFVETIGEDKLTEVASILRPLGYRPVLARATTPVWHFAHRRNLSPLRVMRIVAHLLAARVRARLLRRRSSEA